MVVAVENASMEQSEPLYPSLQTQYGGAPLSSMQLPL
jgi:hypothetical protein